jgi:hypothetical protein
MARLYNNIQLEGTFSFGDKVRNLFKPVKVQVGNLWYQEIQPKSFYSEEDLERAVLLNLQSLFPDFFAVTYKRKLQNLTTKKKNAPDLALIHKNYESWFVIEVELADHNIAHIEQQISTFHNTTYGHQDTEYFVRKNPGLFDQAKLDNLINSKAPNLMVIANEYNDSIQDEIQKYDCKYCVFQMFLDRDSNPLYRLDGDYPLIHNDFCFCFLEKTLPYAVKILDDDQFIDSRNLQHGDVINIAFNSRLSKWELDTSNRDKFLICNSLNLPLEPSTNRYMLSYNKGLDLYTFSKA